MSGVIICGIGVLGMFVLAPLVGVALTLIACIPICVVGIYVTWVELS